MRGVDLQVGSKLSPYQAISTEVMKFLMKKIEVAVKGKVSMLERRDFPKKYPTSWVILWLHQGEVRGS